MMLLRIILAGDQMGCSGSTTYLAGRLHSQKMILIKAYRVYTVTVKHKPIANMYIML